MDNRRTVLLTGVAGFIGMHVALELLRSGCHVVGIDDLNDYYSVKLKMDRLACIQQEFPGPEFEFHRLSIEDDRAMRNMALEIRPQQIVHLAAQAGVRFSMENPMAYARANLLGTTSILEVARELKVERMIYASSSSVYGASAKAPYAESNPVDAPISFYAATKVANEAMAASYSNLYGLSMMGLRFFTVYGPWGRPDMAPWKFTKAIMDEVPLQVYGRGIPKRDFTYVADVADSVKRLLAVPIDAGSHQIVNIGNQNPITVDAFLSLVEKVTGKSAQRELLPMQQGDALSTCANTDRLAALIGDVPATPVEAGLTRFVDWYTDYHGLDRVLTQARAA